MKHLTSRKFSALFAVNPRRRLPPLLPRRVSAHHCTDVDRHYWSVLHSQNQCIALQVFQWKHRSLSMCRTPRANLLCLQEMTPYKYHNIVFVFAPMDEMHMPTIRWLQLSCRLNLQLQPAAVHQCCTRLRILAPSPRLEVEIIVSTLLLYTMFGDSQPLIVATLTQTPQMICSWSLLRSLWLVSRAVHTSWSLTIPMLTITCNNSYYCKIIMSTTVSVLYHFLARVLKLISCSFPPVILSHNNIILYYTCIYIYIIIIINLCILNDKFSVP